MNMSVFDPESFMSATTEQANDTVVVPLPAGEYNSQIEKIDMRQVEVKGESRVIMEVTHNILDDTAKAALGRDKITVRQSIWLDITSQGQLDSGKGKNIGLGKLRAAADMNQPGKPFAPSHLMGAVIRVKTGLRPDKNDPTIQYAEVQTVGRAV